jgi:hypothetical protein
MTMSPSTILAFYGLFLIFCGIASVVFIGLKAKTALISGGTSGALALAIGYWFNHGNPAEARMAGLILTLALFCVFSWRSTKTLYKVFELIPTAHPNLKDKSIAFLIISLMAVVSIFVFVLQLLAV